MEQNLFSESMGKHKKICLLISDSHIHLGTSCKKALDMPVSVSAFCIAISDNTGYFDRNSAVLAKVEKKSLQE